MSYVDPNASTSLATALPLTPIKEKKWREERNREYKERWESDISCGM